MDTLKFLDPKNDFAFKKVFGTESNKDILIHFLSDVLVMERPLESVTFLKPSLDPDIAAKKQSIVDILCQDESGYQYIVEMQVAHSEWFVKRAQLYAARVYSNQLFAGDSYERLRPVIFIAITDFIMFKNKKGFKSDHVILDKEHLTHDLKDFSFTFLELPKFNKTLDELKTNIDYWMYFFKHAQHTPPQELEKLCSHGNCIGQAYQALDQYYWTEEERDAYAGAKKKQLDDQAKLASALNRGEAKGLKKGYKKGIEKGRQEGLNEGKRAIALNLLLSGMTLATVGQMTGLSPDEVEDLRVLQSEVNLNN